MPFKIYSLPSLRLFFFVFIKTKCLKINRNCILFTTDCILLICVFLFFYPLENIYMPQFRLMRLSFLVVHLVRLHLFFVWILSCQQQKSRERKRKIVWYVKSYLRAFPFSLFVRMLPFGETNVPRDELTPVSVESLAAECII